VTRFLPTKAALSAGLSAILSALAIAAAVSAPVAVSGCSKSGGGDNVTAPASSACSEASFDSSAGIGFSLGCSSISFSVSGITYDQFSRKTSYNYDVSCTGGSNRKTGRVYNITYNNLGQALTWDYTVNGTTCRKS